MQLVRISGSCPAVLRSPPICRTAGNSPLHLCCPEHHPYYWGINHNFNLPFSRAAHSGLVVTFPVHNSQALSYVLSPNHLLSQWRVWVELHFWELQRLYSFQKGAGKTAAGGRNMTTWQAWWLPVGIKTKYGWGGVGRRTEMQRWWEEGRKWVEGRRGGTV